MRPFAMIDAAGRYLLSDGEPSHFTTAEMTCRCGCGAKEMDQAQIDMMEATRTLFGSPIRPNSGVRCWTYNKKIGGAENSQHLPRTPGGSIIKESGTRFGAGRATDFNVNGYTPRKVHSTCDREAARLGIVGLGKYPSFTHADTRDGKKARWEG